jgi:hypothetical protein
MDGLLRKLLFGNPEVTTVWLIFVLIAVIVALFWLVGPRFRQRSREAKRLQMAGKWRRERLVQQASEESRYASEVGVAARRARERELSLREKWLALQQQTEAAWKAYDAAETQLLRLAVAGAIPLTDETEEFCERELQRVATAACLRGELSPVDLSDALQHNGPWDPRRHPADQEITVRRNVRRDRHAAWRQIAEREFGAWEDYANAATQARSLRDEATAAQRRAKQTDELLAVAVVDRTKEGLKKAAAERDDDGHDLIQA